MWKPNLLSFHLDVFFFSKFCLCHLLKNNNININIVLLYNDKMQQNLQARLELICEQPLPPLKNISGRFCLTGDGGCTRASLDLK